MEGHGGGRGEGYGIWGRHELEEDVKVGGEWMKSSIKVLSLLRAHAEPPTERENWWENPTYPTLR